MARLPVQAEAEAVDLLMEVQQLPRLLEPEVRDKMDERNTDRMCQYLMRSALSVPRPPPHPPSHRTLRLAWRPRGVMGSPVVTRPHRARRAGTRPIRRNATPCTK